MGKSFAKELKGRTQKLTLRDLWEIIKQNGAEYKGIMDKPITMSSDEEGNEMLYLASVELDTKGVVLWPARFE